MFYRHDGSDNLIDSFDFKFRDFYGLETDLQTMHIRATSKDMLIWVRKVKILIVFMILSPLIIVTPQIVPLIQIFTLV